MKAKNKKKNPCTNTQTERFNKIKTQQILHLDSI